MSKRDAMHKLANAIETRTGIRAEVDWRRNGRATTWYLRWGDGPTVERMRARVKTAARSIPGITASEVEYERTYRDDFVVAAWIRGVLLEERGTPRDFRHMADTYYRKTSFPDDIGDDHEIWGLVREAFEACGGPYAHRQDVIDHIAEIGINGVRVERWFRGQDDKETRGTDPATALLNLDESTLTATTRSAIDTALAAIKRDLLGDSSRTDTPLAQMIAAEHARTVLAHRVDQDQRKQALLVVAGGTTLEQLSTTLGLPQNSLSQRWDTDEFTRDLAPLVWLREHAGAWEKACVAVHTAFRDNPDARETLSWDARNALANLSFAVERGHLQEWHRLVSFVPVVRQLLDDVRRTPPPGPREALHELDVLLAEFDHTSTPGPR